MAEFILGMREKYLQEDAKMLLVTHDWGAVIGARLAAEASQLADRWVIASVLIVGLPSLFRTSGYTDNETAGACVFQYHGQSRVREANASHIRPPTCSHLASQECI